MVHWVLVCIVVAGIFLRTYHFHDWLTFRDDQARDASFASQVAVGESPWPLMGAFMSFSGDGDHSEANSFHLGPAYTYFQIVSTKVFGDAPETSAYPDVLFGMLTIPLFYFFLRSYFSKNLSVGITGLFAISSYFIQYSRFSWNTNLIPFFVLLFLLSLYRLLENDEETRWRWALILGVAVGFGVQLHVIVMIIFLVITGVVFLFSLMKRSGIWKEWVLVALILCALNATQIVSEIKTDFSNTRILFHSTSHRSAVDANQFVTLIGNGIDCHIEANAFFLSSYGSSSCTYDFLNPAAYSSQKSIWTICMMLGAVFFSSVGYLLLGRYIKKEKDVRRKNFLRLIALYTVTAFLVMIPLNKEKFSDLRYLTPLFFMPFVLFGLCIQFLNEKFQKRGLVFSGILFLFVIVANGVALSEQFSPLFSKTRTCSSHFTTLGELEPVAQYLVSQSAGEKAILFRGDQDVHVIFLPLAYLLKKQGIDSMEIGRNLVLSEDGYPAYLISCKLGWRERYPYVTIGGFFVFQLQHDTL